METLLFWTLPVVVVLCGIKGRMIGAWRRFLSAMTAFYIGVWCAPLWWNALNFLPPAALPYRNALAVFVGVVVLFIALLCVSLALSPAAHEEALVFPRAADIVLNTAFNFGFGIVLSTFIFVMCCATPLKLLFRDNGGDLNRKTETALLKLAEIGDKLTAGGRKVPRMEELADTKFWYEPPKKEEGAGNSSDSAGGNDPTSNPAPGVELQAAAPAATPEPEPSGIEISVIADTLSKVYGESDPVLSYTLTKNVPPGTMTGTLTRVAGENVGIYSVTRGTLGTKSGYRIRGFAGADFTITKRKLQVSVDDAIFNYNGMEQHPVKYQVNGLAPGDTVVAVVIDGIRNAGVYGVAAKSIKIKNVSGDDVTGNYDIEYVRRPGNVVVNRRDISISANALNKICGENDPPLTYTQHGLIPGDTISGTLTRVAGEDVGKYAITQGTLDVGNNYRLVSFTGADFTIQAGITVVAGGVRKIYGTPDPQLPYTIKGGTPGDTINGTLTRVAGEDVGKYAITQGTLEASGNCRIIGFFGADFTIVPRELSIEIDDAVFTYDGTEQRPTKYTVTGLAQGDSVASVTIDGIRDAGVYSVAAKALKIKNDTGDDVTANYNITYVRRAGNVTVNRRELTITANPVNKRCGDADPRLSYSVEGIVPGDRLNGALTRTAGEDAGVYAITKGTLDAGNNYHIAKFNGADFVIGKRKLSVSIDNAVFDYNGTEQFATKCLSDGLASGDRVAAVKVEGVRDVGVYSVVAKSVTVKNAKNGDVTGNYDIKFETRPDNVTVKPRALTITAVAAKKIFGEADPQLSYTAKGLVPGDALSGAPSRVAGEAIGTYAITQGTLDAGRNYRIDEFVGADFTIAKRTLSIAVDNAVFTYNGTEQYPSKYTANGLVAGDAVASVSVDGVRDAGVYSVVAKAVTVKNAQNADVTDNYEIKFERRSDNVTVKPKELAIAARTAGKTYGEPDPALAYTVTGLVADEKGVTGSPERVQGEAVGRYAIRRGTLNAGKNYRIASFEEADFTIARRPLTVSIDDAVFTYNGAEQYATQYTVDGLVAGDSVVAVSVDGVRNAGSHTVAAKSVVVKNDRNGDVTGNYAVSCPRRPGNVTVKRKDISIVAEPSGKVRGAADPKLSYKVTGLVDGDVLTGEPVRDAGEEVGIYLIRQGTLDAGRNYRISEFTVAEFTISAPARRANDASGNL